MVGRPEGEQPVAAGSGSVVLVVGVVVDWGGATVASPGGARRALDDGATAVDMAVSVDDVPPAHPVMSVRASTVVPILRVWSCPVTVAACSASL